MNGTNLETWRNLDTHTQEWDTQNLDTHTQQENLDTHTQQENLDTYTTNLEKTWTPTINTIGTDQAHR
jgi:hypothetical protein